MNTGSKTNSVVIFVFFFPTVPSFVLFYFYFLLGQTLIDVYGNKVLFNEPFDAINTTPRRLDPNTSHHARRAYIKMIMRTTVVNVAIQYLSFPRDTADKIGEGLAFLSLKCTRQPSLVSATGFARLPCNPFSL